MLVVEKKRFIKHRARAILELSKKGERPTFSTILKLTRPAMIAVSDEHGSHSNDRQYFFNPLKAIIFSSCIPKKQNIDCDETRN